MTHIIGISGSLRAKSYNSALLRAAVALAPEGMTLEIARIDSIPLYNGDVEERGIPEAVTELKKQFTAADGVILCTPEYNNSIPGVLKNTIDWLSRPAAEIPRIFGGRPVALMGASQGPFGTTLSQAAWLPVLRTLQMHAWFGPRVLVSRAATVFDDAGELIDPNVRAKLTAYLAGFSDFVAHGRP